MGVKKQDTTNKINAQALTAIPTIFSHFKAFSLFLESPTKTLDPSRGYTGKRLKNAIEIFALKNGLVNEYAEGKIHHNPNVITARKIFVKGPASPIITLDLLSKFSFVDISAPKGIRTRLPMA